MSENTQDQVQDQEVEAMGQMSEKDMLKQQARMMGIEFSNNIGVDALKAKIAEAMEKPAEPKNQVNPLVEPEPEVEAEAPKKSLRQEIRDRELALVRVRITNLDPSKKDRPGEILTVANKYIGTVRKYIPFGEQTDNGYHVPRCLLTMLQNKRFCQITVKKDPENPGRELVLTRWVREFAIEELEPLTRDELKKLATAQMAAGSVE